MRKIFLTAVCICFAAFTMSCEDDSYPWENQGPPNNFTFKQSELIVEVDETTTSFRIEGEFSEKFSTYGLVGLDTLRTTAKHKIHFINTGEHADNIGDLTQSDGLKAYRDVTILPENITEEVAISYFTTELIYSDDPVMGPIYGHHTTHLTVKLIPKAIK